MFSFVRSLYKPKIFFLGVFVGIFTCALIGRFVSTKTDMTQYSRLGGGLLTRSASFQITALDIKSLISKKCDKNQILIIIGGSSVFFGSGQPIRYLWSKRLQDNLGSNYCVVNLAVPAGPLVGYGSVALEMSVGSFKDVLLVTDASALPYHPADGFVWYKHLFWDAYYKKLISNIYSRNYTASQIDQIEKENSQGNSKAYEKFEQIRLGMWLDSILYFNELWNYVAFNKIMTIYDPLLGQYNWGPLNKIPDLDYEIDVDKIESLAHYPSSDSDTFRGEFGIVKSNASKYYAMKNDNLVINSSELHAASQNLAKHPLSNLANKVLIVSVTESPYYLEKLSSDEYKRYVNSRNEELKVWHDNGFHTLSGMKFEAKDFGDRPHLNTLGGNILASDVANKVKKITKE